jgi:hypothetical protein
VTATLASAPGYAVIAVTRYSGVDPNQPLGAVVPANSNGPGGGCSGGVDTAEWLVDLAATGGAVAYGAVGHRNQPHTPGFGFEERAEVVAGAGGTAASVSVIDASVDQPRTVTVHGLFGGAVDWAAIVAEIRPTAGVFSLDLTTTGSGRVDLEPPGRSFPSGTEVELHAVPDPGWRFQGWSGALSGSANPETLVVSANHAVTAAFEEVPDRTLAVGTVGLGDVLVGPPGGTYHEGTEVVLAAEPAPGWRFDRWEGDLAGSENPAAITVVADHSVSAVFEKDARRSIQLVVAGSGVVRLSPPGGEYAEGTVVTLEAEAVPGWRFDEWWGSITGLDPRTTIVMSEDRFVVARFRVAPIEAASFAEVESGGSEDAAAVATDGIVDAAVGDLYLAAVTTNPPTPVTGIAGLGLTWGLVATQCSGDGANEISVWKAQGAPVAGSPVTATLALPARTAVLGVARYRDVDPVAPIGSVVGANANGAGGGCTGGEEDISYELDLGPTSPGAIAFGAISHRKETHSAPAGLVERIEKHQGNGQDNTSVAVVDGDAGGIGSVVAGSFSGFVEWAGIAVEIRPRPALGEGWVLETSTQGLGQVAIDPPGAYYAPGASVTLAATPAPGWEFDGWTGGVEGAANPVTITMDRDVVVLGTFAPLPFAELVTASFGGGNVVLDPPGGTYAIGASVEISAEPLRGWTFERWEGDVGGTANPVIQVVGADRDVVAVFRYDGPVAPGLWSSAAELADAPMIGPAWNAVLIAANEGFHPPIIAADSDDNVRCLAAAIVHARTGDPAYRQKVVEACDALVAQGIPPDDTLAWAREVGAYALAADLVGHRTPALEAWFRDVVEVWEAWDGRTVREMYQERPNNWGTMAFATLCAVYAYLDDFRELVAVRRWWIQGVRGPNPGWSYGNRSWHVDPDDPRQINPPGATKDGVLLDGGLPDDLRRGGSFADPPGHTEYAWGALQGLTVAARILERHDPQLVIWHVEDKAIYRAARLLQVDWDQTYGGWAAQGDDAWLPHFFDEAYGTFWATEDPEGWEAGKNAGWPYVLPMAPLPTGVPLPVPGPESIRLEQNFPNPFGSGTSLRYHLRRAESVRLTIYDIAGRAVVTLLDGVQPAGAHTLRWNGVDARGRPVASGVYWCRVETAARRDAVKLTLIR